MTIQLLVVLLQLIINYYIVILQSILFHYFHYMGNCMNPDNQRQQHSSGFDIEIALVKYIQSTKLNKGRKEDQILRQQKSLVTLIRNNNRNRDEQYFKMIKIINSCKELRVLTYQINYAAILRRNIPRLKPQKNNISQSQKNELSQFEPYLQSLHFINTKKPSSHYPAIEQKFFVYLERIFRQDKIPQQVLDCFKTVAPTQAQLSQYMIEMCLRNQISQQMLTKVGHKILIPKNDIQLYGIPMAIEE